VSVFQQLERYVPPGHLDDWRRWVAYTAKYKPTDEIAHICQAAGWLALLTCETPSHLAEQNDRFLEAISAQRIELQNSITKLTENLQHQPGKLSTTTLPTPQSSVVDLQPAAAKILEAADTLTHLSAERIKWGLLLAWGFGLLSYPLIQFLWTTLRQIAHF
jgi:hypothetical protein